MATSINGVFDPKSFLASVGEGRSISKLREGEVIFAQGDPAEAREMARATSSAPRQFRQGREAAAGSGKDQSVTLAEMIGTTRSRVRPAVLRWRFP